MSATKLALRGGWLLLLLRLGTPQVSAVCGLVFPSVEDAQQLPDYLVRVQVKRLLSGVVHNNRVIPQPKVIEISDYTGIRMNREGYYVAYVGSAWSDLAGVKFAVSIVSAGIERPGELVGFDERVSLAVVKSEADDFPPALFGNLQENRTARAVRNMAKGPAQNYQLDILRVLDSDFEAEREVRVRVSDSFPLKADFAGFPLLDERSRFLGFITMVQSWKRLMMPKNWVGMKMNMKPTARSYHR